MRNNDYLLPPSCAAATLPPLIHLDISTISSDSPLQRPLGHTHANNNNPVTIWIKLFLAPFGRSLRIESILSRITTTGVSIQWLTLTLCCGGVVGSSTFIYKAPVHAGTNLLKYGYTKIFLYILLLWVGDGFNLWRTWTQRGGYEATRENICEKNAAIFWEMSD